MQETETKPVLTVREIAEWISKYESVPFNQLPLEVTVANDHSPMHVFKSTAVRLLALNEAVRSLADAYPEDKEFARDITEYIFRIAEERL